MELRSCLVLIFSQVLLPKIGSTTLKPAADPSIPVTLEQKMAEMVERLEQKLTAKIEAEVKDLSTRLDGQREEILKKVSDAVHATTVVFGRLQNAERTFIQVDTHLLAEVQRARSTLSEATENIRRLQQEVAKADNLQVKINDTQDKLKSVIDSAKESEAVIRKNITEVDGNLKLFLNDSLNLGFQKTHSNFTEKMRDFENSLRRIEKDCANSSFVSKMDESMRNREKDVETIRSEFSELKERCEDVAELNKTLSNHSSVITALNKQLFDIQNSCPDPPEIANGYPLLSDKRIQNTKHGAVVTYACRGNRTLARGGGIVCRSGEWTGDRPECMNSCNTEDLNVYDGLDMPMKTNIHHSTSLAMSCRPGYIIASTSESLTCLNGTWSVRGDPCMKEICDGEPPAVKNGKTLDFERNHFSKVRYECYPGFVMSRYSTVRCQKGEWDGQPTVCSVWDATFCLQTRTTGSDYGYIYCNSVGNGPQIDFSRELDTGSGAHLPADVLKSSGTDDSYIDLRKVRSPGKSGSFQCGFGDERGSMNISVQLQDATGDLYFEDHSKVADIGDAVELKVKFDKKKSLTWRHDGLEIPSWKDQERVGIPSVQPSDAGIYECYYEGERGVTAPALLRLIVRKCQKNLFGENCHQQCPPCYNGGICHDHLGVCVCPPGFSGDNCEMACVKGRWGEDCSRGMYEESTFLFCRPYPYGCACQRGFKGFKCDEPCEPGWYGADCKQPCHCSGSPQNCDKLRGTCSEGCSPGWTGQSCQIQVVD